jgi:glycosyltransferase involved in cell wall biosynthesis
MKGLLSWDWLTIYKYYLSKVNNYSLQRKVKWLGRVPWSEVMQAYLENDVILFTSLRESFGNQHLEAMACGLPIITLKQFGARGFMPNRAGFKVEVTSPAQTID